MEQPGRPLSVLGPASLPVGAVSPVPPRPGERLEPFIAHAKREHELGRAYPRVRPRILSCQRDLQQRKSRRPYPHRGTLETSIGAPFSDTPKLVRVSRMTSGSGRVKPPRQCTLRAPMTEIEMSVRRLDVGAVSRTGSLFPPLARGDSSTPPPLSIPQVSRRDGWVQRIISCPDYLLPVPSCRFVSCGPPPAQENVAAVSCK